MKNPFLSIILFCCCIASFADEPVEVMVLMKARYDRTELCRRAEYYPTRAARRDYVVNELKAFSEASQYDLMLTLNELEQQGLVSSVHSLCEDIADHLWDGGEEFPHHGYDFANMDDDPMDDFGHGTHCAGVNYYLFVQLSPKEGFVFDEHPTVFFDGNDSIFGYGAFTDDDYRVYTIDYQVTNPTDVAEQTAESKKLYPNPVENILYLDIADGAVVSVFDMTGRMVKREHYMGQLDVSQLVPGIYTIKVDDLTVRFVKE